MLRSKFELIGCNFPTPCMTFSFVRTPSAHAMPNFRRHRFTSLIIGGLSELRRGWGFGSRDDDHGRRIEIAMKDHRWLCCTIGSLARPVVAHPAAARET